jgi:hypothetical protein
VVNIVRTLYLAAVFTAIRLDSFVAHNVDPHKRLGIEHLRTVGAFIYGAGVLDVVKLYHMSLQAWFAEIHLKKIK